MKGEKQPGKFNLYMNVYIVHGISVITWMI